MAPHGPEISSGKSARRRGGSVKKPRPRTASPGEIDAIRSAIVDGRQKAAVRLLRRASRRRRKWPPMPESWLWVGESAPPEKVIPVALRLSKRGHYGLAAAILSGTNYREAPVKVRRSIARALDIGGQHAVAASVLNDLLAPLEPDPHAYSERMRIKDTQTLGVSEMHLVANSFVKNIEAPTGADLKGFVLVYNVLNPVLTGLMLPLVRPLMEEGYGLAAVTAGTLRTQHCKLPDFDSLQGCVAPDGESLVSRRREKTSQQWTVDWTAGIVEAAGINYFPYFHERLSQKARRYRADIHSDPETAHRFGVLQRRADVALTVCERLLGLAKLNKPIRIAMMDSHFAPQGVIREWCSQVGYRHGIHVVALGVGYENYFSNLTSLEASTLAVEDLTAQPELRQPFLGGSHRLVASLSEDPGLDRDPDDQLMALICQNRSSVGKYSRSREHAFSKASEVRADGGQVFVALGKVSIDFAAPGDRGFVHDDFVSWINHLIEAVSGSDNLLLIKPHPHELRREIVVRGVQLLRELVVPDLPQNVLFLDHDSFNTHDLAALVDVAFLWNGTAALEFSILGVPVIPGSIWADRDYPVGLQILEAREEYEEVLQGKRDIRLSEGVERRAATLLRLMRSEHVAIPYRYIRRAATNLKVGAPMIDLDRLSQLEKLSDPFVERASSRFFEFS